MNSNIIKSTDSDNLFREETLKPVLDSLNSRPKRQSMEGFEHLRKLLPPNPSIDTRMDIELMPDNN